MNVAYNTDCLEAMKKLPDGYADLIVADPPFGINRFKNGETSRLRKYGNMDSVNNYPFTAEMFDEMRRVSKNQIIFGFNHLCDILPPTSEFIFWYKHQPVVSYSDGELAWTSFNKTAKCFDYPFFGCHGADEDNRIHPTQKPIALYKWIYNQYLPNGGSVVDPFLGSGSSRIAAYEAGLDFIGYEIDPTYFQLQEERFERHTAQLSLFTGG